MEEEEEEEEKKKGHDSVHPEERAGSKGSWEPEVFSSCEDPAMLPCKRWLWDQRTTSCRIETIWNESQ